MSWSRAWWIAKQSLNKSKFGFFISVLLNLYMSLVIGYMSIREIIAIPREQLTSWGDTFVTDSLLLVAVSVLGFAMTKDYRTYWSTDSFSRRLVFLRSLPIRVEEIVLARFQQMLVCTLLLSISFFLPLYFFSTLGELISVWEYIEWSITWVGISIILGGFFVFVELGSTGKQYLLVTFIIIAAIFIVAIGMGLTGFSFFLTSIDWIEQYGLIIPIFALVLAFVFMVGWMKLCERRVRTRNFDR